MKFKSQRGGGGWPWIFQGPKEGILNTLSKLVQMAICKMPSFAPTEN
jgi:hypothetical protein